MLLHCCVAGDRKSVCSTCICALVDVFTPALVAGGVEVNTTDPSTFPLDKSAEIIRQCSEQYLVSMLMANVNVTSLASLSECSFGTNDKVPDCLAGQVADIQPGVNNTAFKPDTTAGSTGDCRFKWPINWLMDALAQGSCAAED
eukprot:GHUV01039275.1.p1 GENE.GHUV01039275.1~~GHUV01039275.1.p1  ORF type:complete len:144 (+),score=41.46 GHUV01039275.1:104-535(+)